MLPFIYVLGPIGMAYLGSCIAVVDQVKRYLRRGLPIDLLAVLRTAARPLYALGHGHDYGDVIVLVGYYYGHTRAEDP